MKRMITSILSAVLLLTVVIAPLTANAGTQDEALFVASPQIDSASYDCINLVIYPGYEYRINGGSWTASRSFPNLQPDTEYTFQQRNTANGAVSEPVVFKTHHRGPSTTVNNEQLLNYIDKNGAEIEGYKTLVYLTEDELGSDYYFVLSKDNEKTNFGLIYDGTTETNLVFDIYFELDLTEKNIDVGYEVLLVSENQIFDQVTGSKYVSRNGYTPDYDFQIRTGGNYLDGSTVNELVGLGFGMLMDFWDAEMYATLGFGFKGLGFPYYYDGLGTAVCDLQTTYHTGKTEILYKRDPNCVADGSYGYYVCTACGEQTYWGGRIPETGIHTYDNACDAYCNDCGQFRTPAQHTPDQSGVCTVCGGTDSNIGILTGTLTGTDDSDTTFTLLQNAEVVKTLTVNGNTYLWEQLQPGDYTLTVAKENHVTYTAPITVKAGKNSLDLTLCRPGDVVGLGTLNIGDVSRIYSHIRGTSPLTGYALACADVNGNGTVNMGDISKLYAILRNN